MAYINQSQFMRQFNETHREEFEAELFKRDNEDLIRSIEYVVRSCERDKYFTLKLVSFEVIYNYEDIYNTLRAHEEKRRRKNNKLENSYDFINIKDTDMILIKLEWFVRHNGVERLEDGGKTIEVVNPSENLEVLIALPRFTKGYYFRLSGNYYTTTFQIVDGSTYNNSTASQSKVDTVTLKTIFSPLRIFRCFRDMTDIRTKTTMKVVEYNANIFSNTVNAMYYLLAHYGIYGLCQFLEIDCINLTTQPVIHPDILCFKKHDIYISCPRICFQDPVVQSFCATLYAGIYKDTNINDLFNVRYWLKNLGAAFKNASIDKGLFVLDSVDGIYDNITKRDLHLPDEDKENIYTIIRWLLREFSQLRVKENVDVRTKRIRITDYVAAIYANKLNKGMYRISDLGKKVTLKKVIQAIYTQPLYILNNISSQSNLVSYRDMVNDNDATVALKYTYKGISGFGEDGASVQPIYRYVDPSHVGILDLDASSGSDPGLSGMICPMKKIYNNSFSEYEEPNTWKENYAPLNAEYKAGKIQPIEFTTPPKSYDFYKLREQIVQEELELTRVVCPIENMYDPNIVYTFSGQRIEDGSNKQQKSLFNIIMDEDENNNRMFIGEEDDNDDFDDMSGY